MLEGLKTAIQSVTAVHMGVRSTYSAAFALILLYRWGIPNLLIVLRHLQIRTLMKSLLDHQIVVFEFEVLNENNH